MDHNITIIDDFLKPEHFTELKNKIISVNFPWYYNSTIVSLDPKEESINGQYGPGQFTNIVYLKDDQYTTSPLSPLVRQLIAPKINWCVLDRIKLNFQARLPTPYCAHFHTDIYPSTPGQNLSAEYVMNKFTTAILYMNTNNRYTELEDGTIVNCVENRLVTFPVKFRHRGVSQTDKQFKIVINFNYLERKSHDL